MNSVKNLSMPIACWSDGAWNERFFKRVSCEGAAMVVLGGKVSHAATFPKAVESND